VVLPSEWYENGPYSAMEAMAAGKPLIVSGNGGLPELVDEGENGFIYQGSAAELADCIQKMLALSDEEYKTMANCAVDKAKALFDPVKYVKWIEELQKKEI
jgi:glycosyltransferase involved in cell wall biosynthesis